MIDNNEGMIWLMLCSACASSIFFCLRYSLIFSGEEAVKCWMLFLMVMLANPFWLKRWRTS